MRSNRLPGEREGTPDARGGTAMTTTAPPVLDADKLMAFVFRAVDEVGATLNTALVVMGDALGYYRTMAEGRPATPAERPGTSQHHARECLRAQPAGAHVDYDAEPRPSTLPAEHAAALVDESSP